MVEMCSLLITSTRQYFVRLRVISEKNYSVMMLISFFSDIVNLFNP
jgi:hypothetical protein